MTYQVRVDWGVFLLVWWALSSQSATLAVDDKMTLEALWRRQQYSPDVTKRYKKTYQPSEKEG